MRTHILTLEIEILREGERERECLIEMRGRKWNWIFIKYLTIVTIKLNEKLVNSVQCVYSVEFICFLVKFQNSNNSTSTHNVPQMFTRLFSFWLVWMFGIHTIRMEFTFAHIEIKSKQDNGNKKRTRREKKMSQ